MTTILWEKSTSFRFSKPLDESIYTDINIMVQKKQYDTQKIIFDISYQYTYSPNNSTFIGIPFEKEYQGDIILANPMTSIMVEYLLMPLEDTKKICGDDCPLRYKSNIMLALTNFWD
jgi:hypothetical protein